MLHTGHHWTDLHLYLPPLQYCFSTKKVYIVYNSNMEIALALIYSFNPLNPMHLSVFVYSYPCTIPCMEIIELGWHASFFKTCLANDVCCLELSMHLFCTWLANG